MVTTLEPPHQNKSDCTEQQRHRLPSNSAGTESDNISLRPSWGRAVTRACTAAAANCAVPSAHGQGVAGQSTFGAQKRPASAMTPNTSPAETMADPIASPTSRAPLRPTVSGVWFPQLSPPSSKAHSIPDIRVTSFVCASALVAQPASGLNRSLGCGSCMGQQLMSPPSYLYRRDSTSSRSAGAAAAILTRELQPGSQQNSGRVSPGHGDYGSSGAAAGNCIDGGVSFQYCSHNSSSTANGAPQVSPFYCRNALTNTFAGVGNGLTTEAEPLCSTRLKTPKLDSMLTRDMSHGSAASSSPPSLAVAGTQGPSLGLGPGQVYLVVDPSTGLVVGTAQATGERGPLVGLGRTRHT